MIINKNIKFFREAVKAYLSNYSKKASINNCKLEIHNNFGAGKRRLKVRKKGKMGLLAHFSKKQIQEEIALRTGRISNINNEKEDLEIWLNLKNPETFINLKKL